MPRTPPPWSAGAAVLNLARRFLVALAASMMCLGVAWAADANVPHLPQPVGHGLVAASGLHTGIDGEGNRQKRRHTLGYQLASGFGTGALYSVGYGLGAGLLAIFSVPLALTSDRRGFFAIFAAPLYGMGVGVLIGFAHGAAIGVHEVRSRKQPAPPIWGTYLGSGIGLGLSVGLMMTGLVTRSQPIGYSGLIGAPFLMVTGAIIGSVGAPAGIARTRLRPLLSRRGPLGATVEVRW